ncbi:MAG: glycosyltransferase [Lachnospiraceae bacterium]|nr:glycosyltransferase [Lachnospiraceae bacterium]
MNEILVSVITPCYNSSSTIEKTLECIEDQTYKNLEYIIIDGGSTDDTLKIIERHKDRLPSKLKIVSEKDNGIYDAMNKGIKLAQGKLIGIVNSDDWYEKDTIEQVVNHYSGSQYEVIYGMQRNFLREKEKAVFLYHHDFLSQQMITHPTCFVTADTYRDFGVFDTKYRSAADYDLMLRFYESKKVVFTPIMRVLSNFRLGGMSGSQIGVRENAIIRYKRGYMSKKRYRFVMIKSRIYQWLTRKK